MLRLTCLATVAALAMGCKNGGAFDIGLGEETDARLTSDVYTWDCESQQVQWMGVFGFDVTLEFVPDELKSRELPGSGCSYGLSMFAQDTLDAGSDLPVSDPRWRTDNGEAGRLAKVVDGLYYDDVFTNNLSCNRVDDIITDGVEIYQAGPLNGTITPEAGDVTLVEVDADVRTGIPFGAELGLSWDTGDWQESFVQIRRVRDDVAYETVTCVTTGDTEFTVDDDVWSFMNEDIGVDINYLYVGFRNRDNVTTESGQKVEVETRALHVVGVVDLSR